MRAAAAVALVLGCAAAGVASADGNSDIELIPQAVQQGGAAPAAAPSRAARAGRLSLEDALTLWSLRDALAVPVPPPGSPTWRNRTSLDGRGRWQLGSRLGLTLSDRLNVIEESDFAFSSRQSLRNDWREGYLTWEPASGDYLEGGRINVRNGVALGFNPTDFFKTRTLVDQSSLDPSVLRENRLGTLMLRGETIWNGGAASVAVAPRLYPPTPVATTPPAGFRAGLDRTNASDRVLLTASLDVADLSPQLLAYREGGVTRLGLNLTRVVGKSVVLYAEWAGGSYASLIARALDYGRRTGTLPASAAAPLPVDPNATFQNDLALGASWTGENKLSLNVEYLYHQAGFTRADWRNWFAAGTAHPSLLQVTGLLWYLRGYAADQQEPMTREQLFLRADWPDVWVTHLELSAFAFVNLYDGSALAQVAASYYLSDAWTLGAYLSANLGGSRSERGSLPQAGSVILQLVRYF